MVVFAVVVVEVVAVVIIDAVFAAVLDVVAILVSLSHIFLLS